MPEKILQTRIINKNADLSSWNSSTLPLKKGEIALAKFDAKTVNPLDGSITITPAYAIKVGVDGEKAFKDCAWLYAPASDVQAWAKAETKPDYLSSEISRGEDKGSVEDALVALEAALGTSGSVSEAIKAAIEALDVEDTAVENQFVTAVAETDGKISVTRRALAADDVPNLEISKINGLQDALNAKAATTYVDSAVADAKAAGTQASTDLAEYEIANDARVKAIEDDYTTAEEAGTIAQTKVNALAEGQVATNTTAIANNATAISNEETRAKGVEGGLDTRLTAAETAINALNAATTFAGTGTYAEMISRTDVGSGAIFVIVDTTDEGKQYNNKEFVYDGSNWIELGDTTAELAAINELDSRLDAVETSLGDDGAVTQAIAAAKAQADQGVADAKLANDAIAVITGEGEGSIAKALVDANAYTDEEIAKVSESATQVGTAVETHVANKENPHEVTKAQVGLSEVENKSTETIKSEFTGTVAENDTGFVTGGATHAAIAAAQAAADDALNAYKTTTDEALGNINTNLTNITTNYIRVEGNELVYGQGETIMTIVFDCGGAE